MEHWDNLQETATATKSGHSMTDGPATASDLDQTVANKALIKSFYEEVMIGGQGDKITNYVSTAKYVCARIRQAQKKLEEPGAAKITRAYHLPARFVLHTVGPIHESPAREARYADLLAGCYTAASLI